MRIYNLIASMVLALSLSACGGGGGNAGSPLTGGGSGSNSGSNGDQNVNSNPILGAVLQDTTNATTTSISASGYTLLVATLTDPSGNGVPGQVVTVSGDPAKVMFPEGSGGLTDADGVVTIKVARASLLATGADLLTLTYAYKSGSISIYPDGSKPPADDTVISKYLGYQLSAANITLTNLNVGALSLAAYGTRAISVQANVNGVAATSSPVQVSFTANCGTVTPSTASTNSSGVVQVSYSAVNAAIANDQGCSGTNVSIVASTTGANPLNGSITVSLAPATNLLFQSATPATIYLTNSGGATQSIVKFKLVNSSNSAIQGQDVQLELQDLAGGIPKTTFGTVGNVAPVTLQTNAIGEVSVPVFSGTVPTSAVVKATLVSNVGITTTSSVLAIASGRAVQSRTSLAVSEYAIEGANIDGVTTDFKMSLADRQGNPVPDGTAVNFVTEGGVMIPPTCTTVDSVCSVSLRSQNPRPNDGRVSVLAYAAGEEDFVDANFDNVYTNGESFTDLGNAFRDDDALIGSQVGTYQTGFFSVPRAGTTNCGLGNVLGRPGSCDGVWGAADVRQQQVVVFATSSANINGPVWNSAVVAGYKPAPNLNNVANTLTVTIQDQNPNRNNSMPTGTTIDATAIDKTQTDPQTAAAANGLTCTVVSKSIDVVPNTIGPVLLQVNLKDCVSGDQIQVSVTSPNGLTTVSSLTVP